MMFRIRASGSFFSTCGKQFFLSNSIHVQTEPIKASILGQKSLLAGIQKLSNLASTSRATRFLSQSKAYSRWSAFKGNAGDRYANLNRFQMYQGNQGSNGNSIGKLSVVGLSVMGGIFLLSPYLFQYVPPFTYFRQNPSHLVYGLLGINTVVFGLWQLPKYWRFLQRYMLLEKDHIYSKWSLIGSAFSHQEVWHLGMNMLALWSFGTSLASILGASNFFSLYMNSALAGSLFSLWYPRIARLALRGPSLGASGALFGVFGCFSYLFPHAKILLFVFPIPGGAWVAFLAATAWNAAGCLLRWGSFDYAAHLGGSVIGILYGWYISEVAKKQREKRLKELSSWF